MPTPVEILQKKQQEAAAAAQASQVKAAPTFPKDYSIYSDTGLAGLTPWNSGMDVPQQPTITQPEPVPTVEPLPDVAPAAAPAAAQPSDDYDSLSKTQKRMLAFAALHDAGQALQGNQGTMVRSLLGDFSARADQKRKERQAALELETETKRREMLMSLFPSGAVPDGAVTPVAGSVEAIQEQLARLRSQMGAYASLDQIPAYQARLTDLQGQLEAAQATEQAKKEEIKVDTGKLAQAKDAREIAKRALSASLGVTGAELDAKLEAIARGDEELDPASFLYGRQGILGSTEGFKNFKAAAEQLGAMMTFENMAEVIAAGAKLGILSDSDIKLLGSLSGVIDADNMPVQTAQSIFRLYSKLNQTIDTLEGKLAPSSVEDRINALRKKYEKGS